MTKMFKKCLTDQRFIQKRNTTYKIHTLEDREFQFVYLCSLLSNKQFLTVQNGSKFQIFLLNENHIRPAMFAIFFRVEIMKKNTDSWQYIPLNKLPSFSGYIGPQRWSSRHWVLNGAIFISKWGTIELVSSENCNGGLGMSLHWNPVQGRTGGFPCD